MTIFWNEKTKNWMLLSALAVATLASTLHAQTTRSTTHSVTRVNGAVTSNFTSVSQGGGEEPQQKDDLFAGAEAFEKNATSATEINMGPDTLGMVGGRRGGEARNTVLKTVRSYSYDKPGMYDVAAVDAFRKKLNTGDWFCSIHTRELKTGESTDVCQKRRTDGMREEAIITVEPKELTFIHTITKQSSQSSGDGGHSSMWEGPLPSGVHGEAAFAMMDPDSFVMSKLAQHGLMMEGGRGLVDLKLDSLRLLRDSQLATIRPLTMMQLDGISRNLSIRPDVHVHVHQDFDSDGPIPAPAPLPALEAVPASPAEPAQPAVPAEPATPAIP